MIKTLSGRKKSLSFIGVVAGILLFCWFFTFSAAAAEITTEPELQNLTAGDFLPFATVSNEGEIIPEPIYMNQYWDGKFYTNSDDITKKRDDDIKCASNKQSAPVVDNANHIQWQVSAEGKSVTITFLEGYIGNYNTIVLNMSRYAMAFTLPNRSFKEGDVLIVDGTPASEKNGDKGDVSYFLLKNITSPTQQYDLMIIKQIEGENPVDDDFSFAVYRDGEIYEDDIQITTSGGNGSATIQVTEGSYTVVEVGAGDSDFHYNVTYSPEGGVVSVSSGQTTAVTVTVTNTPKVEPPAPTGSLIVVKVLDGEKPDGQVFTFTLTKDDESFDETIEITIGTNGQGTSQPLDGLLYGTYTLTEDNVDETEYTIDMRIGSTNSGNPITFVINDNNAEVTVTVTNTLIPDEPDPMGELYIHKQITVGSEDDELTEDDLFGKTFTFTLFNIDGEDPVEIVIEGGISITTDENGYGSVVIPSLPFGTYLVKENGVNEYGYLYVSDEGITYLVSVTDDGVVTVGDDNAEATVTVTNTLIWDGPNLGELYIHKQIVSSDEDYELTEDDLFGKTFTFTLFNIDDEDPVEIVIEGGISITTDENGYGSVVIPSLPFGTYLVKENGVNEYGYLYVSEEGLTYLVIIENEGIVEINDDFREVSISVENQLLPNVPETSVYLLVNKYIDSEDPAELSEKTFHFAVTDADNDIVHEFDITTDENGEGSYGGFLDIQPGVYTLREVAPADGVRYTVVIDNEGVFEISFEEINALEITINVYNTPLSSPTGSITINKQVEGGSLSGTFSFLITGNNLRIPVEITTGAYGFGSQTVGNLPYGVYIVTEVGANDENFPYTVEITNNGIVILGENVANLSVTVVNTLKPEPTGTLTINKRVIGLNLAEKTFYFNVTGDDYNLDFDLTTDASGNASFTIENLPYGQYSVTEVGADSDSFPYRVDITNDGIVIIGEDAANVAITVYNVEKDAPPIVVLNVDKYVWDGVNNWVNYAEFRVNDVTAGVNVHFMIVVSMDIDDLLAYNLANGTNLGVSMSGYLSDTFNGVTFNLENGGAFNLYYIPDGDTRLSQSYFASMTLYTTGNATNTAVMNVVSDLFEGELIIEKAEDSAYVTIAEQRTSTTDVNDPEPVNPGSSTTNTPNTPTTTGATGTTGTPSTQTQQPQTQQQPTTPQTAATNPQNLVDFANASNPLSDFQPAPIIPPAEEQSQPAEEPATFVDFQSIVPLNEFPQTGVISVTLWSIGVGLSALATVFLAIVARRRGRGPRASKTAYLRRLVPVGLAAVIICICGLTLDLYNEKQGQDYYQDLSSQFRNAAVETDPAVMTEDGDTDFTAIAICRTNFFGILPDSDPTAAITYNFEALEQMIPGVVAWLYCEGTNIDYPIMQATDNSYFLDRLPNGTKNKIGSIFMDYRNASDFSGQNTVIYGHHIQSGAMFGSLEQYKNQEYYDENSVLYLYTPEQTYKITLFAGYVGDPNSDSLPFSFAVDDDYDQFVADVCDRSLFTSDVPINPGDKLVSLCTCTYNYKNAKLILVGKLEEV